MEIGKTLYVSTRRSWRNWLLKNHKKEKDIWLLYPKKHTGKARIPYGDAVEEALCFGWIDSIAKKVDDDFFAQRFSPRRKGSMWSEPNIIRMRRLISSGLAKPPGIAAFEIAGAHKPKRFLIASDILRELKREKSVWENFDKFPESYKRIRISFIERRRANKEEFRKRLDYFIKKTRENKRFAFGGVQE